MWAKQRRTFTFSVQFFVLFFLFFTTSVCTFTDTLTNSAHNNYPHFLFYKTRSRVWLPGAAVGDTHRVARKERRLWRNRRSDPETETGARLEPGDRWLEERDGWTLADESQWSWTQTTESTRAQTQRAPSPLPPACIMNLSQRRLLDRVPDGFKTRGSPHCRASALQSQPY